MRFETKEIRQSVFPAKQIGDCEDHRGQQADFDIRNDIAKLAIDDEMIARAGQPGHAHNDGNVDQQDRAAKDHSGKRGSPSQEPICIDWGRQRVGLVNVHGLYQYG